MEVAKLWLNGKSVKLDRPADLTIDVDQREWRLAATLPDDGPYARTFTLAFELGDGTLARGVARLVADDGDGWLTFEGVEPAGFVLPATSRANLP